MVCSLAVVQARWAILDLRDSAGIRQLASRRTAMEKEIAGSHRVAGLFWKEETRNLAMILKLVGRRSQRSCQIMGHLILHISPRTL